MGRGPAYRRVARVFGVPEGVIRSIQYLDRISKARVLEGAVPLQYPCADPWPPLGGHGAIDIVDDRLDWLTDRGVGVALLQPPAVHVANEEALGCVARE